MPLSDHARWRVVLRAAGTIVAVAGVAVAVWLIVRGDDSKTVQIGVIVGLAAALVGSATFPATRRPHDPAESGLRPEDLDRVVQASTLAARTVAREAANTAASAAADAVAEKAAWSAADAAARNAVAAVQEANAGRELERRRTSEVEHERDEATRREFALSLELMLRREMERVLRDELEALRQEVAGLRNDLTEKVPGQIRLERIETTRLIGSDLEALQTEVRRLAEERVALGGAPGPAITLASTPANVRPADVVTPAVTDPLEPAPPAYASAPVAAPVSASEPESAPAPESERVSEPQRASEPERTPAPVAAVPAEEPSPTAPSPELAPAAPSAEVPPAPAPPVVLHEPDPFAGLPRLSRWVDPYADEPESDQRSVPAAEPTAAPAARGHAVAEDAPAAEDHPRYVGRRRQADEGEVVQAVPDPAPEPEPAPEATSGRRRHAKADAAPDERSGGRRRRRDDDETQPGGHARPELVPDDVLTRLLGR